MPGGQLNTKPVPHKTPRSVNLPTSMRTLRTLAIRLYQKQHFTVCKGTRRQPVKMGREDQIEEREVLESIFPDEIIGTNLLLKTHVVFFA